MDARDLYREFHWGRAAARELHATGPDGCPGETSDLGALLSVGLANGRTWRPRGVRLACDAAGLRLFFVVVGKRRPPRYAGSPARAVSISYRTDKNEGRMWAWVHRFEGQRPMLARGADGWPVLRRAGSRFRVTWRGIEG